MTTTLDPTPPLLNVGPVPWWLRGGHLETILPALLGAPVLPFPADRREVEVTPGCAVETFLSRPLAAVHGRGSVLVVHGLGGSAGRPHVQAMAVEALSRGWHAVRMNLRNHGGTAALSSTLFHAAQSEDVGAVLEAMEEWGLPRPYVVLAISLGANTALRYASIEGDASRADAIAALNPALDFFRIEQEIARRSNLVYRMTFVRGLCRMIEEARALREVDGPAASPWRIKTVRRFDAAFTAPAAGYPDVDEYYADAGAGTRLDGLRVPALLLTALNDPFVPADIVRPHHGAAGGRVQVALADRGGHVGYRIREGGASRFWAAATMLDWAEDRVAS
ncbi:MAG: alpha/beta fold hydrolase [Dehalococcoidia bacterium]